MPRNPPYVSVLKNVVFKREKIEVGTISDCSNFLCASITQYIFLDLFHGKSPNGNLMDLNLSVR
jgi:hypothetical protein